MAQKRDGRRGFIYHLAWQDRKKKQARPGELERFPERPDEAECFHLDIDNRAGNKIILASSRTMKMAVPVETPPLAPTPISS
ncbi:hypothetical protein MMC16_002728 [Acarospora aff. strigata]|nr:hypothetical protein [Acarospora aff. strigata]